MSIKFVVKGLLIYTGLSVGLIGCATLGEETSPLHSEPPVIEKTFAQKVIYPGDPWKVYIKASDQDGDMSMFILDLQRTGWPTTPHFLGVGKEHRKELSGYLILYSSTAPNLGDLISLVAELTVIIEDKAGTRSKPVTFPLEFDFRARAEEPEAGYFEEVFLGMIPAYDLWQDQGAGELWLPR